MPRFVKRYRYRFKHNGKSYRFRGWNTLIRDYHRIYPSVDDWIEDVDRRQGWNKKRDNFLKSVWS